MRTRLTEFDVMKPTAFKSWPLLRSTESAVLQHLFAVGGFGQRHFLSIDGLPQVASDMLGTQHFLHLQATSRSERWHASRSGEN